MRVWFSLFAAATLSVGLCAHADTVTTNLLTNPGAETGNLSGWTVGGDSNPNVDNGSFDPGIDPHSGAYDFSGHTGSFGSLSQTFALTTQGVTGTQIDAGTVIATLSFWEQGLNQGTPSDSGEVLLTFLDGSGNPLGIADSGEADSHELMWENFTGVYKVPTGARAAIYEMEFIRHVGSDNDAFIDDNSLVLGAATTPGGGGNAVTPEPSSLVLLGSGLLGLAGAARRRWA